MTYDEYPSFFTTRDRRTPDQIEIWQYALTGVIFLAVLLLGSLTAFLLGTAFYMEQTSHVHIWWLLPLPLLPLTLLGMVALCLRHYYNHQSKKYFQQLKTRNIVGKHVWEMNKTYGKQECTQIANQLCHLNAEGEFQRAADGTKSDFFDPFWFEIRLLPNGYHLVKIFSLLSKGGTKMEEVVTILF